MPTDFRGAAVPLDDEGLTEVVDRLGVGPAEVWAVLTVETLGCGFLADRRPTILFERHVFSRETAHEYDADHSAISNLNPGAYAGGAREYERLKQAIALERVAALRSASWGIGQVMGFNANDAGYANVEEMVAAMTASENLQLQGMAGEITKGNLENPLRRHDWKAFARGYNGPGYAKNHYDTRLEGAYQKLIAGRLPDLSVRSAQVYLMYLGHDPRAIDGLMGRFTRSALHDFQERHGLALTDGVDDAVLTALKAEVAMLPA